MATLYYQNGSSDKVYTANIESAGNLFNVTYAYGRRGSTMTTGVKNSSPLTKGEAQKIYDKLIRSKIGEGYTTGLDGAPYVTTTQEERYTGILPMLLNSITEPELNMYIRDERYIAQRKFDGRRMMLHKELDSTEIVAINRKGLVIGCPQCIIDEAQLIRDRAFTIDGEIIGERFHAFDYVMEETLQARSYRLHFALENCTGGSIIQVDSFSGSQKVPFLNALRQRKAEGIVLKKLGSYYRPGRPNKLGDALKFKFKASASGVVTNVNDQRSVRVSMFDGKTGVCVGNVTITPNYEVPLVGSIIEIEYLYAFPSGSLYQPVYMGERFDITAAECLVAQLKYKGEEDEE